MITLETKNVIVSKKVPHMVDYKNICKFENIYFKHHKTLDLTIAMNIFWLCFSEKNNSQTFISFGYIYLEDFQTGNAC